MSAAVASQLIETSASVVGREAPLALDPAIQLKPLQGWLKSAFFDAQQIVGQLLNQLRDRIPMAVQKIGPRLLGSHRQSDYMTTAFCDG